MTVHAEFNVLACVKASPSSCNHGQLRLNLWFPSLPCTNILLCTQKIRSESWMHGQGQDYIKLPKAWPSFGGTDEQFSVLLLTNSLSKTWEWKQVVNTSLGWRENPLVDVWLTKWSMICRLHIYTYPAHRYKGQPTLEGTICTSAGCPGGTSHTSVKCSRDI